MGKSSGINKSLSPDDILRLREKNNIGKLLVMSFEQNAAENNEKIIEMSRQYSFVMGLYWIEKSRVMQDARRLNDLLRNGSMVGAKFHGSYENGPVTLPTYAPVMEVLSDEGAVLLVHTGRYKDGARESNTSYIHALELARAYPRIKVVFAHMGGSDTSVIKRALQDSKDVANIYFDTSGITTPYAIEYALQVVDSRRILFGSDEPWCSFMSMYYNIADAQVNEDYKEQILSGNFDKLLLG